MFLPLINLLDLDRDALFPAETMASKLIIMDYAMNALGAYVNAQVKKAHFGVDPISQLHEMLPRLSNMTSRDFHTSLFSTFASLRDFHTYYAFPEPHACYIARSGLEFKLIEYNHTDTPIVSQSTDQVKVGDRLVNVQGKPFAEHVNSLVGGSNPDAAKRYALDRLSVVPGRLALLPTDNYLNLTLIGSQGEYNVSVPWKTSVRCPKKKRSIQHSFDWAASPFIDFIQETLQSSLKMNMYKDMAVVKLESFTNEQDIMILEQFLKNHVYSKIVFDVRNNPGGNVGMIQPLVSMVAQYSSFYSRTVVSSKNDLLVQSLASVDRDFSTMGTLQAYVQTPKTEYYSLLSLWDDLSKPFPRLTTVPVGVLTDASCYSACDVFSMTMKESGAVIIGEDASTGGGGANVFSSELLTSLAPSIFPPSPIMLAIGWRQVVSVNQSVIEDVGVTSDHIVKPSLKDIVEGSQEQMETIYHLIK